jgi:hypothetical protein
VNLETGTDDCVGEMAEQKHARVTTTIGRLDRFAMCIVMSLHDDKLALPIEPSVIRPTRPPSNCRDASLH